MYANLAVSIARKGSSDYETVYAHEVVIYGPTAFVKLDAQDGEGSYAEPAGVRTVSLNLFQLSISADF